MSFSNGTASKQIAGSKAGTIVLVNRDVSMASSLMLDGCLNGGTTITFTCYNTDNKTNYTGSVTINALVIIPE